MYSDELKKQSKEWIKDRTGESLSVEEVVSVLDAITGYFDALCEANQGMIQAVEASSKKI